MITNSGRGLFFLKVLITPNSKKISISDSLEEYLSIHINAPARDGKANKELLNYLSEILNLPKSKIDVYKGHKAREKVISIQSDTLTVEEIYERIKSNIPMK
ncbi:hypothetical protein HZS_2947 [Henneguya salminicola]|nr:hypothetical protein HZS_2947 [Henneguya salminicola]